MKTIKFIFSVLVFFILSTGVMAQVGPPDPPGEHGSGDDEAPGGGAPIGSGVFILLGLSSVYGSKKVYNLLKEEDKD